MLVHWLVCCVIDTTYMVQTMACDLSQLAQAANVQGPADSTDWQTRIILMLDR
jgi:hypothetical protein